MLLIKQKTLKGGGRGCKTKKPKNNILPWLTSLIIWFELCSSSIRESKFDKKDIKLTKIRRWHHRNMQYLLLWYYCDFFDILNMKENEILLPSSDISSILIFSKEPISTSFVSIFIFPHKCLSFDFLSHELLRSFYPTRTFFLFSYYTRNESEKVLVKTQQHNTKAFSFDWRENHKRIIIYRSESFYRSSEKAFYLSHIIEYKASCYITKSI